MAQERLQDYIDTLKNEGIMDGEYEETRKARTTENLPNLMVDLINYFLLLGDNSMRELEDLMSVTYVNFPEVHAAAHLIHGGGKSLGGCGVVAASHDLIKASLNQDKQSCETSFEWTATEYYIFRDKLRTLYEMEMEIIDIESRRRG